MDSIKLASVVDWHDALHLTLKDLFHHYPRRLLRFLSGCEGGRPLTVEYPEVRQRRPDLVLELDDGRLYHLEIQSVEDADTPRDGEDADDIESARQRILP